MLRLGFGFLLFGLLAATQAAQFDDDFSAPRLNLITKNFVHTSILPRYQFSASVAFIPSPDTTPTDALLQLPTTTQQEALRALRYQQAYDSDRMPHVLRVELKGQQARIAFQPRSVLIEKEEFKIRLRPQSASIVWIRAF